MDGQAPSSALPPLHCVAPWWHMLRAPEPLGTYLTAHGSDELTHNYAAAWEGLLVRNEEPRRAISEVLEVSEAVSRHRPCRIIIGPSQLVIRLRPKGLGPRRRSMGSDLWSLGESWGGRQVSTTLLPPNCGTYCAD